MKFQNSVIDFKNLQFIFINKILKNIKRSQISYTVHTKTLTPQCIQTRKTDRRQVKRKDDRQKATEILPSKFI